MLQGVRASAASMAFRKANQSILHVFTLVTGQTIQVEAKGGGRLIVWWALPLDQVSTTRLAYSQEEFLLENSFLIRQSSSRYCCPLY